MILIGQFDSPFVRRAAVALNVFGLKFERHVLSVFTEFERLLEINPLGKVPILQLDSGELLYDSQIILDYLDRTADPAQRLMPAGEADWLHAARIDTTALGLAQKAYERGLELVRREPGKIDPQWVGRIETQIWSVCDWLEALEPDPWLFGDHMTRADITCATAFTYLKAKHRKAVSNRSYAMLEAHCAHCEARPEFQASAYSASEALRSGWREP